MRPYYTPEQCEAVLAAVERGDSYRQIADDLFWSKDKVRRCHLHAEKIRAEGALGQGAHKTLPGFGVSKVSTLHNRDGEAVAQWVQQRPDAEQQQLAIQAAFDAMASELPRVAPIDAPTLCNKELANLYTLTDSHVGMLAWRKEGGADWDLDIAERTLLGCFSAMVSAAPKAGVGIVNIQGDFLHFDGLKPVTPEHGHILDADSRFSKVVSVAIRVIRRVVDLALEAHPTVHLLICEGNHDESSAVWLRQMFAALYELEPRLTVNDSELPYYVYQHGHVMLAFHHGHKMKNDQLPMLFAAQYPVVWGATTKRYCHTGHRHHEEVKEHSGMVVTQHSTLAARDAYAARGGWVSERQVKAISYHTEYGQVAVNTIVPEMLAA